MRKEVGKEESRREGTLREMRTVRKMERGKEGGRKEEGRWEVREESYEKERQREGREERKKGGLRKRGREGWTKRWRDRWKEEEDRRRTSLWV